MTDHDLMRWEDDGGYVPPDPEFPDGFGPPRLRKVLAWCLTYDLLRRLFAW